MNLIRHKFNTFIRSRFHRAGFNIERKTFGQNLFDDLIACIKNATTIVDVGANVGAMSHEFARAFPRARVYAFEPDPRAFRLLSNNVVKNSNIVPCNVAIGADEKSAKLNLTVRSEGNTFLAMEDTLPVGIKGCDWARVIDTTETRIIRLDNFCTLNAITKIDILKVDTQGYDLEVLKGAGDLLNDRRIALIYVEVEFVPLYQKQPCFQEIYQFLFARSYKLVDFYMKGRDSDHTLISCDALFRASSA